MHMRSLFFRYGLAIGLTVLAQLVTRLVPLLSDVGILFLPLAAIILTALYGGRGPALLATLLSALALDYFFIPPVNSFLILPLENAFGLAVFTAVAFLFVEIIEARRRERRTLQAGEERWKAVFENNPSMYFMLDETGIIQAVNPFGAEQLGYRVEELVRTPVLDIFHEADREAVQRHVSACLTHVGQPMMWEFRNVRKDGRVIWVHGTAQAVRFDASQRVVLVACEDMTDRKRVEQVLQERANLLDLTHDTVFVRDMNDVITYWNRGAEELYGWRKEEAVGQVSYELLQVIFTAPLDTINEQLRTTDLWDGELIHTKWDGTQVVVASRWSLQRDEDGKPVAILETNSDITERKRAEALLEGEKRILEMVARGASLGQILDNLCRLAEEQAPDVLASILLVERNLLRHGGAPSLPKEYTDAIDGLAIGPCVGSCGTAAYRGEQVIVSDIAIDALWSGFRAAALPQSLRACCSTPIFSSEGTVIGTFAMYYREPRSPSARDQQIIGQITELAGVAIQRKLADKAKALLGAIVESSEDAIISKDTQGIIRTWNRGAEETFGYTAAETVGQPASMLIPSRLLGEEPRILENIRRGEKIEHYETVRLRKDGTEIHISLTVSPIFDDAGNVVGASKIAHDITERKRAEEIVRRSEKELRDAIETIPTMAWTTLPDGSVDFVNRYWREYTGLSTEDTVGSCWQGTVHPEDMDRHVDKWQLSLASEEPFESEVRYRRAADGQYRWFLERAVPLRDQHGAISKWYGISTDIDDRKLAEQRVLAQNTVSQILAEAASLQEAAPRILQAFCESLIWDLGALWETDKHAGVLRCVEIFHKSIEFLEFEAETRASTFKPGVGLPGAVWQSRKPIYVSDLSRNESAKFPRAPIAARDGLHSAFAFPILLSGDVLGVIEFFNIEIRGYDQDLLDMMITIGSQIGQYIERKRAEDTVRTTQVELAHVARVVTLGELTASIAHEINQPLGAIVNNASASLRWLAAQNVNEVRQSIECVIKDGHRASEIIKRIRDLIKKTGPKKNRLYLNEAIREVLALMNAELQAHWVAPQLHLSPDLPAILGDGVQVQQVLLNLMKNAIEAMIATKDFSRELRVRSEKLDAQSVVVTVQDSGPGITQLQQDRLFEAFYSTKADGLGMGLTICRSIIEAHGGRLWATANEDRGAAFHFTLPIDRPDVQRSPGNEFYA